MLRGGKRCRFWAISIKYESAETKRVKKNSKTEINYSNPMSNNPDTASLISDSVVFSFLSSETTKTLVVFLQRIRNFILQTESKAIDYARVY